LLKVIGSINYALGVNPGLARNRDLQLVQPKSLKGSESCPELEKSDNNLKQSSQFLDENGI
jgi:hypothetical protein